MCHCLTLQSDYSTLVTCLICTPRTVDVGGGGDIIWTLSEEVGDEGEDESISAGAESRRLCLVALRAWGREKIILSGW